MGIVVKNIANWTAMAASVLLAACSSGPAPRTQVQSPLGYVPPFENQWDVPIEVGPIPVPMTYGQSRGVVIQNASAPIEMVVDERGFHPDQLSAQPGQLFTIRLVNRGQQEHGLALDLPNARVSLPEPLRPGETRVLQFAAPLEPGTYSFYSPVNRDSGLEGRLIVSQIR